MRAMLDGFAAGIAEANLIVGHQQRLRQPHADQHIGVLAVAAFINFDAIGHRSSHSQGNHLM
ncbi:hypothetical protein [Bradyrhizobium sp. 170]|uniref:hypothetical protein n=1 Tax=Bradyrhizobium sp. 170 TaxID=2782641 RepID=UPI0020000E7D|nr:hypothetical protein [Bradyrhizobium sp. 170]UPK03074.1 hypothetical protein IVB05_36950 [Bradyrhizobium sp. 170]